MAIFPKPILSGACCLFALAAFADADPLSDGFASPPPEHLPETWFHLIGGNVSKPGLTADLEAIRGAGFQGVQLFHGSASGGPWKNPVPQIECLSPSWDSMIGHAADECGRLGLRFTMQNCPGWAMSGGPWIKPSEAMRHLVWSRTDFEPAASPAILPKAPEAKEDWRDYRDVAVIAFPTPLGDGDPLPAPAVTAGNRPQLPWAELLSGKPGASVRVDAGAEPAWIEVDFGKPVTLRSLELPSVEKLTRRRAFDPAASILVQTRGADGLKDVARRAIPRSNWQDDRPLTLALPDATAAVFRITFENKTPLDLTVLRFSSAARLDDWEGGAGFVLRSLDHGARPAQDRAAWVASKDVLDLSAKMDGEGRLDWQAPSGKWTVLRFGHVNTGAKNGPAPPEATGFECDKLSTTGADAHFAGYIGRISARGGPADGGRLKGMVIDSWECHTQTWTPAMEDEFLKWRGYPLRKWLPALAGMVVEDHVTSRRFLRDWRATLNDLLVSNYYSRLALLGRQRGMKLSFESGPGDVPTGDILQYYGRADIPMCEFWWPNDPHWGGLETKPMLPAVSAAHVYGKPRIAAEAFTNIGLRWDEHPFMLKHLADRHFAMGLTHLVFHTYTHNPDLEMVPGTSFGRGIGTPFLRGQTWWKHMPLFTGYIARCGFMLEQGVPVADALWYLGDDFDHKPRQDEACSDGHKFDYLNSDALTGRISVDGGLLKSPEGLSWRFLYLPHAPALSVASLEKIRDLVKQGAVVLGLPSFQNPSLTGDDGRFETLLGELWEKIPAARGDRRVGEGRVIWGVSPEAAMKLLGIAPDVSGTRAASWCHRRTENGDVYFVAADRESPLDANLGFRATGRPEFWDPLTGKSTPVHAFSVDGDRTLVPVSLPAAGSVFVVFRSEKAEPSITRIEIDGKPELDATDAGRVDDCEPQATQGLRPGDPVQPWVDSPCLRFTFDDGGHMLAFANGVYQITAVNHTVVRTDVTQAAEMPVAGPWALSFPAGWDAPDKVELPALKPWTDLEDPAARHFSGTAIYQTSFRIDAPPAGTRLVLDLGKAAEIVEIVVNGKSVATLWTPPFRADITSFANPGENRLEVRVTNTWFNRLVQDAGLPQERRKTWTINGPPANAPLRPSGLMGPVVLRRAQVIGLPVP